MGNYTELYYHFVWATRKRQPYITEKVEPILFNYIRKKCADQSVRIYGLNGLPDHVHLACEIPTTTTISDFMGMIKGTSARFVNAKVADDFTQCLYWQSGFGVLSFSARDLPIIVRYIESQKEAHQQGKLKKRLEIANDGYDDEPSG